MTRFALLLAAAVATLAPAAFAPAAHAQTLRSDLVVVEGDLVRLSDLFDGVNSDRAVLRAPAPGRRVAVEIAQLMEIARVNNLAWRPQTRFDRVRATKSISAAAPPAFRYRSKRPPTSKFANSSSTAPTAASRQR